MFRRSTKATALLLAAASVLSVVPATAATKLGTKEGTIEKGIAFSDGKYLYQGYRTDEDDNGLYYNAGDKDKLLDDADEILGTFGRKYVSAKEGNNDYYVIDMETGKITDEDTIDDLEDTAKTKLQNKLKNADRIGGSTIEFDKKDSLEEFNKAKEDAFFRVSGGRFQENLYVYKAAGAQELKNANTNENTEEKEKSDVFGFTNDAGKYIDCSYDLNLYAYSATTTGAGTDGKMYKVEDVDDTVKTEKGGQIQVKDIKFVKYIGQDDKYIYSVIKVKLDGEKSLYSKDYVENAYHYYVQKVSKEQGDKKDDVYLPKSTECFEIAPEKIHYNDGEIDEKTSIAMGNDDIATAYDALLGEGDFKDKNCTYAVVDGSIYVYYEDDTDKLKIVKIKLATSEKLDRYYQDKDKAGNKIVQKDKTSNKISGHVALKVDDTDHSMNDAKEVKNDTGKPWSVDVNGTVWIIDSGKIYKNVKCGSWELVYTCDRSLDCIDVYDENNLIAWASDGDVYTTVTEGSEAAKDEAEDILGEDKVEDTTTTVKTGWDQLADGTWNLYDATGAKVTGWANVGGVWYYMDPTTAVMRTGWILDNGTWYYCNASGAMQTGWLNDNGTWYYLQSNGAMKTGWLEDTDGRWYFLQANGAMAANTTIDGYVLGANGAWIR